MTECAVCGAEIPAGGKLCSFCGSHSLADELLSDPGFEQIRSELGKALEWQFYRQHSHHLHTILEAEQLIGWFHARDPEEIQALAVAAVIAAGFVKDPWEAVLHPVSVSIGVSQPEAQAFIEDLQARGIVRIKWMPVSLGGPGMEPLPRLCCWVECDPDKPAAKGE